MNSMDELLIEIRECSACYLMEENNNTGIPYIPILAKLHARVAFVGRDPSPRTTKIVGIN